MLLTGTEAIRILDSGFDQPGGNAVFVRNYSRRTLIKGCHIHDAGTGGLCFGVSRFGAGSEDNRWPGCRGITAEKAFLHVGSDGPFPAGGG